MNSRRQEQALLWQLEAVNKRVLPSPKRVPKKPVANQQPSANSTPSCCLHLPHGRHLSCARTHTRLVQVSHARYYRCMV